MDALIERFHKFFGIDREGRDRFVHNDFHIEFYQRKNLVFSLQDEGVGLQDVILSTQATLTCGGVFLPAGAIRFLASLPTGDDDELYGSGGVDLGATLLLSKRMGIFYFYFEGGYIRIGKDSLAGIDLRKKQKVVSTALETRLGRTSLLLQNIVRSNAARSFDEFATYTDEITVGMKRELSGNLLFEIGFVENIIHYKNGPDFGIHTGLSGRFH